MQQVIQQLQDRVEAMVAPPPSNPLPTNEIEVDGEGEELQDGGVQQRTIPPPPPGHLPAYPAGYSAPTPLPGAGHARGGQMVARPPAGMISTPLGPMSHGQLEQFQRLEMMTRMTVQIADKVQPKFNWNIALACMGIPAVILGGGWLMLQQSIIAQQASPNYQIAEMAKSYQESMAKVAAEAAKRPAPSYTCVAFFGTCPPQRTAEEGANPNRYTPYQAPYQAPPANPPSITVTPPIANSTPTYTAQIR